MNQLTESQLNQKLGELLHRKRLGEDVDMEIQLVQAELRRMQGTPPGQQAQVGGGHAININVRVRPYNRGRRIFTVLVVMAVPLLFLLNPDQVLAGIIGLAITVPLGAYVLWGTQFYHLTEEDLHDQPGVLWASRLMTGAGVVVLVLVIFVIMLLEAMGSDSKRS